MYEFKWADYVVNAKILKIQKIIIIFKKNQIKNHLYRIIA